MLDELSIHNYKSIRKVNLIKLPPFCVLVGANASGKSNFADSLDFLSLVFRQGLVSAVSTKGGYENICFRRGKRSKGGLKFGIKATITEVESKRIRRKNRGVGKYIFEYKFEFSSKGEAISSEYEITFEELKIDEIVFSNDELRQTQIFIMTRNKGDIKIDYPQKGDDDLLFPFKYANDFIKEGRIEQDELVVCSRLKYMPAISIFTNFLSNCRMFQISPFVARDTGVPERSPELGRHGENLPATIKYLKDSHKDAYEELLAHVQHTVPAIKELATDYVETKQLGLFFKEEGVGRRWFSQDVSDGTIQTVSLFLPLVDPRNQILIIEEPENSLHPWIIRHFIESCKIHSKKKQIFITTQSIVAVNEVPAESLYVVTRINGETQIHRCIERSPEITEVVKDQLMGIGEYWDSGAIAGVPEYGKQLRFIDE